MLDSLNNQPIGGYRLRVENLGQTRFFDQLNFELHLIDAHSNKPSSLIFRGLYNSGRPSIYVPVWIDGEFVESTAQDTRRKTDDQSSVHGLPFSVVEQIAQMLGALIPPGGRFWLAYESFAGEGEMMSETRAGLIANIPLVATPIGFLLFRADCWLGLRDWHFPEGGREGPRKLQGNKAVSPDHARQRAAEYVFELENFLALPANNQMLQRAQTRAEIVGSLLRAIAGEKITK